MTGLSLREEIRAIVNAFESNAHMTTDVAVDAIARLIAHYSAQAAMTNAIREAAPDAEPSGIVQWFDGPDGRASGT